MDSPVTSIKSRPSSSKFFKGKLATPAPNSSEEFVDGSYKQRRRRTQKQNFQGAADEVIYSNSRQSKHKRELKDHSKIYDVLRAFKDDIVSADNLNDDANANGWNEKGITYKSSTDILGNVSGTNFPVHEPPHEMLTVDQVGPKTSRLKTVVLGLTAFGGENGGGDRNDRKFIGNIENTFECNVKRMAQTTASYSSGLLAGFLLWQGIFAMSLILETSSVRMGTLLWTAYWTLVSILMLVTILGFLSTVVTQEELDFCSVLIHFTPSLLLIISHYLIKAIDNQAHECESYIKQSLEARKTVHLSYSCDSHNYQNKSSGLTISLSIISSIIAIGIYTHLHISPRSTETELVDAEEKDDQSV